MLINCNTWAREIFVIEHTNQIEVAKMTKKILINRFQIPESLIQIRNANCNDKSEAILQLCILNNGELEIKKINKYVLNNAFNIFLDKKEL